MNSFFSFKRKLALNLKNSFGWCTDRKLIVWSVDDYGNIRIASKEARENMKKAGLKVEESRFDSFDALEDEQDLIQLFEVLSSVKDVNGNHPVFTTFSVPANPDFEKIINSGYTEYFYELLPETYSKLSGYEQVYGLWQEGIEKKLVHPEFHGREHLNVKMLMELLQAGNHEARVAFANHSYGGISAKLYPTIGYTAAFDFYDFKEIELHKEIIEDGLNQFEKVFGFRARHFNAPGAHEHSILEGTMLKGGIKFIDTPLIKKEHQGNEVYKNKFYYTGKRNNNDQIYIVRNCVFEPLTLPGLDWVDYCMMQIDLAFKWKKPANISTHRVNFGGHIEPQNRENGLTLLRDLLKEIVKKWPDVEFLTSTELGLEIKKGKKIC